MSSFKDDAFRRELSASRAEAVLIGKGRLIKWLRSRLSQLVKRLAKDLHDIERKLLEHEKAFIDEMIQILENL